MRLAEIRASAELIAERIYCEGFEGTLPDGTALKIEPGATEEVWDVAVALAMDEALNGPSPFQISFRS